MTPRLQDAQLRDLLHRLAQEAGFEMAGVARPDPSEHGDFLRGWLERGYQGDMDWMAREDALESREEPARALPEVGDEAGGERAGANAEAGGSAPPGSVLVVGHSYHQPDPPGVPDDPARGVVARYARGRDYHRVIRKKLKRLHRRLEDELGRSVPGRATVDTSPVLERELARRAGIGWFGRNTMLIHPRKGSFFFLGALFLRLEVEPDPPFEADRCGSCRACLDACPTGALLGRDATGAPVMDARRCISYLTIEHRGPIPQELRPLMGNRIYGCDICQEVCPFSRSFSTTASEASYAARGPGELPVGVEPDASVPDAPHPGTDAPSLVALLDMALDSDRWESFSRGSAIRRAERAGFARNVCVALGNWLSVEESSPAEALAVLSRALSDTEPLVRGHAAWALGRSAGEDVCELLSSAAASEADAWVAEELEAARFGLSGKCRGEVGDGAR